VDPVFIAGVFSGLAILTKGPVGYLIIALTWFVKLLIFRAFSWEAIKRFAVFSLTALVVALSWFGVEIAKNGTWFVQEFMTYTIRLAKTEDAGHGGFFGYHFVVLFLGCFPASIFALRALWKRYNFFGELVDYTRWMKVLFWVVLILFSLVQSKIVHYSSMCYLPLSFLAAISLKSFIEESIDWRNTRRLILGVGVLLGLVVTAIPFLGQNIEQLKPLFEKDPFALKNLEAAVTWTGMEAAAGIFLILGLFAFLFIVKRYGILRGGISLFLAVAVFVQLSLYFFVNRIEAYSQRAAVVFYKGLQQEDFYVLTYGFKSYAHLFYSRMPPPTDAHYTDMAWLLSEKTPLSKPVYIAAKITAKETLDNLPNLQYLYEKNGFVFYKRQ
jgi:4-amino-4-deoxy-L-arabinose transferase-like glycosyltransferase